MWSAHKRVLSALDFQRPDRVPIYDSFWPEFVETWRVAHMRNAGDDIDNHYAMDVAIVIPDETPLPSQRSVLEERADFTITRDGWGMVQRVSNEAKFYETLDVALPEKRLLDQLTFESPLLDARYAPLAEVRALQSKRCVFIKTGGPYLRTSNLRGTEQWLVDLAEDPAFAYELAMQVTRHITAVGLEALRRYDAYEAGIWFFDDMGANIGPMFSPRTFERVFYPCYRWMCEQYRAAGAGHILLHCDGNIEAILDGLIDAGIGGIHPVEPKAGMDAPALRKRYGHRLALLGGLDNAHILPRGDRAEVEIHVRRVLEAGEDGGLVIGAHSIGPDVSIETYDYVHSLILKHGTY